MIQTKQLYLSPTTETLVVRFEGVICESGKMGVQDWQNDGDPLSA